MYFTGCLGIDRQSRTDASCCDPVNEIVLASKQADSWLHLSSAHAAYDKVITRSLQHTCMKGQYTNACVGRQCMSADLTDAVRAEGRVEHFADVFPLLVVWCRQKVGMWPALHDEHRLSVDKSHFL